MFGLRYTPEEEAFRATLRAWLAAHLPRTAPPEDESERRVFQRAWQRELAAGGWVGIQWPRKHGGRGASLKEQIIFTEEMARARAPEILDAVAVNIDRKSTRLNSSHLGISYAVFCLKKKKKNENE